MLAAGERGNVLARVIVAFTMAKPPAMDELATMVHYDVLKLLGTWRMVGKRPAPARTNSADRNPSGCGELPVDRVRVYLAPRSLRGRDYLQTRGNE